MAETQPSDAQLVDDYLRHRVETGQSSDPLFHAADVYTLHPDFLTRKYLPFSSGDGMSYWYFFTTLRDKTSSDARVRRAVETGGRWHGEHGEKSILDGRGGKTIGYKKTFTFSRKDGRKIIRLGWIMAELRLADEDDDGGGGEERPRVVLCKIYPSPRTAPVPALDSNDPGETSRGRSKIAGAAPPRASKRVRPTVAGGPPGGSRSAVAGGATTEERPPGGSGSAVAAVARTAEVPPGGSKSALAACARMEDCARSEGCAAPPRAWKRARPTVAEGPRGGSQSAVAGGATAEERPRGGSGSAVAAGARTAEVPPGGSKSALAGCARMEDCAGSGGCSCGRQWRKSLRPDDFAARATNAPRKAWVIAELELGGEDEDLPGDPVLHRICRIERTDAPNRSACWRGRKDWEGEPGWLVLSPASAAALSP